MKRRLSFAWVWLSGAFAVAALAVIGWFLGMGEMLRKREKAKASKELADDLKAKVEQAKAQRAEERAATAAEVGKVAQQAEADKARDPVDVANDLIADAKAGKP